MERVRLGFEGEFRHTDLHTNANQYDYIHFYTHLHTNANQYGYIHFDTHFDLDFNIHLRANSRLGICYRKPNAFFQCAGRFKLFVGVPPNRRLFNVHYSIEHLCDGWNAWDYCYGRL